MRFPVVLLAAAPVLFAQVPQVPDPLPEPYATNSVRNSPRVVSRPAGANPKVPQGFQVDVWAEGFEKPRFMMLGPSGELLLADSGERAETAAVGKPGEAQRGGAVYVFANARPDSRKQLIGGLNRPYGLAVANGYLYVAEPASVTRYRYDSKNLSVGAPEKIVEYPGDFEDGHWTRTLLFSRDGRKLYVGIGSESNVSAGEDGRRAAIVRYNPDGSSAEVFASGLRNPIGMHWYPDTDDLWAAVQERDGLGDRLVPDYFTHVQQGQFYGWPYSYIGSNPEPRRKGERPELVKKAVRPDVLLGSHVAVLDYEFYTGSMFPQEYRGGAFIALHGSWNRSDRVGYSIAFVPFKDGKPSGKPRDFLTGWMLGPDRREVWGRPVGVVQMADGSLLISDDGGNKIWRVLAK